VWINPRAFDAELNAKANDTPTESCAVKHFARYWKALDSIVISLSPDDRDIIKLSLGVRARIAELPPAARRLFREGATVSDVWKRFPNSALLSAGGRIDGVALLEVLGGYLTPESRQTIHAALNRQLGALLGEEDFTRDVLPALGPDWGLYITAPAAQDKSWMPQSLVALRVASNRTKQPVDRKLLAALDFAARLIIFGHNSQCPDAPLTLKSGEVDGQEVRYLAGERGLPTGLQPAYAVLQGYLILSSSLDGLTRFAQITSSSLSPITRGEKNRDDDAAESPFPLLRISFKDWKAYLKERREPIVQFLAEKQQLSRDAAGQQLDGLLAGLQFIERVELRQRVAPGQVIFTLHVQTAQALKK
jgi:hypothetical protein